MRRAAKVDANHAEVVKALRQIGCSAAKRSAAVANAAMATAAVRLRLEERPRWECAMCGAQRLATAHQKRQTYCSRPCMAAAYAGRMRGTANPNFSNAGWQRCEHCQKEFQSYSKRRFCGLSCRDMEALQLRTNAKKDANHISVVRRFEAAGAAVVDLSRAMFGCPDLLVWWASAWHLVEIKNPKTSYGKRGLNSRQKDWAREWKGGPVYIVRTDADVDQFLIGELPPAVVESVEQAIAVVTAW